MNSPLARTIVALVALLLGGCSVPALDATGSIHCGDGNVCPSGWECRWGRCCDSNSTVAACPTELPADTTGHAYAPDAQGRCPDGYESRYGGCCPPSSGAECPSGIIGATCRTERDCVAPAGLTAFCVTNQGGGENIVAGYCTATNCDINNPTTSCGPFAYCAGSAGNSACSRSCEVPMGSLYSETTCPGSGGTYSCYLAVAFNDPTGICAPDCTKDTNLCVSPWVCAPSVHQCLLPCSTDTYCDTNFGTGSHCDPTGHYCRF